MENKKEENNENIEKDNKKIPFFRKFWYSIGRIGQYEKLNKEGLVASLKYFFGLVAILAFILAIIYSVVQVKMSNEVIQYLNDNLPEITFKNNQLSLDNDDATIIDNEDMADKLGITASFYSQIENKKRRLFYDMAYDIAKIFNLKPDDLFYDGINEKAD